MTDPPRESSQSKVGYGISNHPELKLHNHFYQDRLRGLDPWLSAKEYIFLLCEVGSMAAITNKSKGVRIPSMFVCVSIYSSFFRTFFGSALLLFICGRCVGFISTPEWGCNFLRVATLNYTPISDDAEEWDFFSQDCSDPLFFDLVRFL